jgi:uncharacterized damage-inducible protein DinB
MTLTDVLLSEIETTYGITEKLFRRVGDHELSWKPETGTNWMTVGQLMMHCASFGCGKALQGFATGEWPFPSESEADDRESDEHVPPTTALPAVTSIRQALELLAIDRELAISSVTEAGETTMLTKRSVAPWGGPEFTLFQHLLHMVDHLAQHKGQLFYYLKLMGKDVNTADLWGE